MNMINNGKKEALVLLLGDVVLFIASLWLTLFLRYNTWPSEIILVSHMQAFSVLFVLWILVFFISGLYDKQTNAFKQKIPGVIFNAEIVNSIIAVLFFYFIPNFGIAPKINLFIYLFLNVVLVYLWRILLVDYIYRLRLENVLLVGNSPEIFEIEEEIRSNRKYGLTIFKKRPSLTEEALSDVPKNVSTIILDVDKTSRDDKTMHFIPELIFSSVRFIDSNDLYENMFDKVCLSDMSGIWFLRNVSNHSKSIYDFLKRVMDIAISLCLGIFSLLLYPLVYLAIKLDDGGSVIIRQERIGQGNKIIYLYKYRTMNKNDRGVWGKQGEDARVTRVGKFLRSSRIDELPQLWNVFAGDVSLVGPRPDIIDLGIELSKEIPNYLMRYSIKPGLSGWAQIHQDLPPRSVEESRERLAYDFYYLKNRSFILDIQIALRTIKTLLSRAGL